MKSFYVHGIAIVHVVTRVEAKTEDKAREIAYKRNVLSQRDVPLRYDLEDNSALELRLKNFVPSELHLELSDDHELFVEEIE